MKLLIHLLSCLLIAVAVLADAEAELKVDVVSVPEECESKSKNGDILSMHYTGTLLDGTKFDSRYQHALCFKFNSFSIFFLFFP